MTLDQINLYLETCSQMDKASLRDNILACTAGARYEKEDLDKLFRQLEHK